ncbi:hypothetical protein K432DRAFT_410339 [Lepidopterella palustris CBS 459.81]|uniref:Uncharacterized protein n=1 Tax=Lepidopterella palustris CBS 459.81 TaxID=1314670 RepID=A0A8E2DY21_9PEZI|nr:hypothetical protein K432DRAFT_410339 [Lepidopterella palustris CBS 459.81]
MQFAASRFFFFCSLASQLSLAVSIAKCPKYPVQQFTQTLDHGSSDNITFQQDYQLDTTRFKPGGPILFYQGAENSQINCIEYNHFDDIADELGAIVAGLEHRFFGDSFPDGVSEASVSAKDWASLNLENVLLDSVTFVEWIKKTVPGAENARTIITGGKYPRTQRAIGSVLRLTSFKDHTVAFLQLSQGRNTLTPSTLPGLLGQSFKHSALRKTVQRDSNIGTMSQKSTTNSQQRLPPKSARQCMTLSPVLRMWITCNYLIFATASIRNGSMFPPQDMPPSCVVPGWEGPNFNYTGQQWIDKFGVSKENLTKLGRFLFTQGGYDPTTAVGPPNFDVPAFSNATRTVLMPGLSHTEELFSDRIEPVGSNPELDLIQDTVTQVIKGWVIY